MERGIDKGVEFNLFVSKQDQILHVGTTIVSDAEKIHDGPQRKLHNRDLPQTEEKDHILLKKISVKNQYKYLPFPYKYYDANVAAVHLSDISRSGFYHWDVRMMVPIQSPPSIASSLHETGNIIDVDSLPSLTPLRSSSTDNVAFAVKFKGLPVQITFNGKWGP